MSDELINLPSVLPVFPLPGLVLFPHSVLPLHIFEPRYRAMMADCLGGDRFLAIALLKRGWEPLYYTKRAPIHGVLGVGRIAQHEQLDDGNYNVLLQGIGRAVVCEEVADRPYRAARIEPVETYTSVGDAPAADLRQRLSAAIRGNPGLDADLQESWLRLLRMPVDLDPLADLLAARLPAEPELRQRLLDEADAAARIQIVLTQVRMLAELTRNQWQSQRDASHHLN